ncbi:MAG: AAA family ATPase [Propionibacteriales bacterium]|nr:AAA family ATPase [Propionibacteriales bacterium]
MDPIRNPYTPNAGAQPQVMLGRDDQLTSFELLLGRLARGRTEQSMIVTGLRGVGKTALLGQFRKKALAADWVVVEMEMRKHSDHDFRREIALQMRRALFDLSPKARWSDRIRSAASVLSSFTVTVDESGAITAGMDVSPAEGRADHGNLALDVADLFVALGEAAQAQSRGVVLLIDEIQFLATPQLEALITGLHKTVQREVPITLVGAGLPQIAELAGDAKSYAERLFKLPAIGSLGADDARLAFQAPAQDEGADFTADALDLAVEITEGYPYFIQELGYAIWPHAQGPTIGVDDVRHAVELYEAKLDSSFFRVRLDRSTEMQRTYLRAMADLGPGPQRSADIAERMGRTSPQVAPTRAELISMGLLYTPEHGLAEFTVPHFDAYMKRAVPDLVVPPVRRRKS